MHPAFLKIPYAINFDTKLGFPTVCRETLFKVLHDQDTSDIPKFLVNGGGGGWIGFIVVFPSFP